MKRALLIGVRTYPFISGQFGRPLNGCHNDAQRMFELLKQRDFEDLRTLVDSRPRLAAAGLDPEIAKRSQGVVRSCECAFCSETGQNLALPSREGIRQAMADLVQAVEKSAEAGTQDVVVIYYSGHGSQFTDRARFAALKFQTIVPFDSGRKPFPNRDILDWEIEVWIKRLNQATPYVTLIFDSCHSGGVADARRGGSAELDPRQADPGDGALDEMLSGGIAAEAEVAAFADELENLTDPAPSAVGPKLERLPSGWLRGKGRSAVVLAACAARELASEASIDGKKHGLFTHRLVSVLDGSEAVTWAEVFPEVAEAVKRSTSTQHPRREGNCAIFEPGPIDVSDIFPPDIVRLTKRALVIGIDRYDTSQRTPQTVEPTPVENPFPALDTAVNDAREVARVLIEHQGYPKENVITLFDDQATRSQILKSLRSLAGKTHNNPNHAVFLYFAGHGEIDTRGENFVGCLIPWDAGQKNPDDWLPMKDLRSGLIEGQGRRKQRARHVLLVLDCCFAGAFLLDSFRGDRLPHRPIYYSEYKRFVEGQAWQLLTSSSFSQQARDRDPEDPRHSPFAKAMIKALSSNAADSTRGGGRHDHIVTAGELHLFIDSELERKKIVGQTPAFMPLVPTNTGEFIFAVPPFTPTPEPDPPLEPATNPWPGLAPYGAPADGTGGSDPPFCGRRQATLDLLARVMSDDQSIIAIHGPSGSGKTSLVRAGLFPLLEDLAAARTRLRAWAEELNLGHYLVSAEDLAWVRQWLADLAAGKFGSDRGGRKTLDLERLFELPSILHARALDWVAQAQLLDAKQIRALEQAQAQSARLGLELGESVEESQRAHRLGLVRLLSHRELLGPCRLWQPGRASLADLLAGGGESPLEAPSFSIIEAEPSQLDDLARQRQIRSTGRRLIFVDQWESLPESSMAPAREGAEALSKMPGVRVMIAVRESSRQLLPAKSSAYRIRPPSRPELLEILQRPAAVRSLVWESPELVNRLVGDVQALDTPLPALSLCLERLFDAAWRTRWRQGDRDRLLTEADEASVAAKGALLPLRLHFGRLAEELSTKDPPAFHMLSLLAPRLLGDDEDGAGFEPRVVPHAELQISAASYRDRESEREAGIVAKVVQRLIDERILIDTAEGVSLAADALVDDFLTLDMTATLTTSGLGRSPSILIQDIRQAAADWDRARQLGASARQGVADPEKARGLLWDRHPRLEAIREMLTERRLALTVVEHQFLAESEYLRSTRRARDLAREATRLRQIDWNRAAHLAVEAAGTPGVPAAAQALHDTLAVTPFSIPVDISGELLALSFSPGSDEILAVTLHRESEAGELEEIPWSCALRDTSDLQFKRSPGTTLSRAEGLAVRPYLFGGQATAPAGQNFEQRSPDGTVSVRGVSGSRWLEIEAPAHLGYGAQVQQLHGHARPPEYAGFSRDGKWLVTGARETGAANSTVRLWWVGDRPPASLPSTPRRLLNRPKVATELLHVRIAVDGRLVGLDARGRPLAWNTTASKSLPLEEDLPAGARSGAPAGGGKKASLWACHGKGDASSLLDLTGAHTERSLGFELHLESASIDGGLLAGREAAEGRSPAEGRPIVVDGRASDQAQPLRPSSRFELLGPLVASSDGDYVAAQEYKTNPFGPEASFGSVRIWHRSNFADPLAGGEIEWALLHPDLKASEAAYGEQIRCLAFSPDGHWLVGYGKRSGALLWKLSPTESALTQLKWPLGRVLALAFSPDGRSLAVGTDEGEVWLMRLSGSGAAKTRLHPGFSQPVTALCFSGGGRRLAAGMGHLIRIWSLDELDKTEYAPLDLDLGWPHGAASEISFSPAGDRLVALGSAQCTRDEDGWSVFEQEHQQALVFELDAARLLQLVWANAHGVMPERDRSRFGIGDARDLYQLSDSEGALRYHRRLAQGGFGELPAADGEDSEPASEPATNGSDETDPENAPNPAEATPRQKEEPMSVDAVARITAMLALDGSLLAAYLPDLTLDDERNEERRQDFVGRYSNILDDGQSGGTNEIALVESGDFGRIFAHIAANLPKPVGGDEPGG